MPLMAEKQIDYLYGTSVNPNGGLAFASFYAPKVSIRFKHAMARVTFHIRKEESNTNAYFLPNISLINVWSSAVLNLYMGTVDLFKGWVTLIGKPDNNILETASQVATVEFLVLPMNSEKVDWDISLGMGELYNEYDLFVMMPPFNWEGGKQYTYEVTIRNGSMSIGEAVITPWEKSMFKEVEKAIINSELGITPENNGEVIRLSIPPLTEERRKALVKQSKAEAENAKISVRNARRDAIEGLKKAVKNGMPEDVEKDAEAKVQKIHDNYMKKIEDVFAAKEKEILTV